MGVRYIYNIYKDEACDCMGTSLHLPKTLETCKKSMLCLVKKASMCAADHMSKTRAFFIFHFLSIKHKGLKRKSCAFLFYFIFSVVKLYVFIFFM